MGQQTFSRTAGSHHRDDLTTFYFQVHLLHRVDRPPGKSPFILGEGDGEVLNFQNRIIHLPRLLTHEHCPDPKVGRVPVRYNETEARSQRGKVPGTAPATIFP